MSVRATRTPTTRAAAWELHVPFGVEAENGSRRVDYVLLRVTGLVLSVLVLGHFAVTHFVTDVAHDNATFVARRLSSAVWIAWDSTMLAAALAHGFIGLRLAVADYASGRRRSVLNGSLAVVTVGVFLVGAIAIARVPHV